MVFPWNAQIIENNFFPIKINVAKDLSKGYLINGCIFQKKRPIKFWQVIIAVGFFSGSLYY
jgi:hypothetical protein